MTGHPETPPRPTDPRTTAPERPAASRTGALDPQAVTFLALVAFPVLAFVCAVMGLILVLQGKVLAGLVFLLVLTQVFALGGLITWNRRRRARQEAEAGR